VKFEPKTYKNYNISKMALEAKSYSVELILDVDLYGKILYGWPNSFVTGIVG